MLICRRYVLAAAILLLFAPMHSWATCPWWMLWVGCPATSDTEDSLTGTVFDSGKSEKTLEIHRDSTGRLQSLQFPLGQRIEYFYSNDEPGRIVSKRFFNFATLTQNTVSKPDSIQQFQLSLLNEGNFELSKIPVVEDLIEGMDPEQRLRIAQQLWKAVKHNVERKLTALQIRATPWLHHSKIADALTKNQSEFAQLSQPSTEHLQEVLSSIRKLQKIQISNEALDNFLTLVTALQKNETGVLATQELIASIARRVETCNPWLGNALASQTDSVDQLFQVSKETAALLDLKRRNPSMAHALIETSIQSGYFQVPAAYTISTPSPTSYEKILWGPIILLPERTADEIIRKMEMHKNAFDEYGDSSFESLNNFSSQFPWMAAVMTHEFGHALQQKLESANPELYWDLQLAASLDEAFVDPTFSAIYRDNLFTPYLRISEWFANWFMMDALAECI